jgi:hypothetical protein
MTTNDWCEEKVQKLQGFLKSVAYHSVTALEASECGFPESAGWHIERMLDELNDIKKIVENEKCYDISGMDLGTDLDWTSLRFEGPSDD